MKIPKRREFNIRKVGQYFYITHKVAIDIHPGNFFYKDGKISHNTLFMDYGEKIYATNDPEIKLSRLPAMLIPKLKPTHTSLTLKCDIINWRPEIIAGMWDGGSYEYDIKPVTDKNNC